MGGLGLTLRVEIGIRTQVKARERVGMGEPPRITNPDYGNGNKMGTLVFATTGFFTYYRLIHMPPNSLYLSQL